MRQTEAQKKWAKKNKDHVSAYQKEYQIKNKARLDEYQRKYHTENMEHIVARSRERHSGWKPEEFKKACIEQQGLCFICGEKRKLVGDHDHVTSRPRRPLCSPCNAILGSIENPAKLEALFEYVRMFR